MKRIIIFLLLFFSTRFIFSQTFNYAEALQKSLYFYDAEKCGTGIDGGRLTWRGDCHVADVALPLNEEMTNMSAGFISANRAVLDPDGNGTLDVSGGYHDAGDHVQFGLPQSYSSSTLEWALYEFRDAFADIGELSHMNELLRWASDYYIKCTYRNASGNVVAFCYQVGEGNIDHNFWGPPELIDTDEYPRPAYFATSETPASDQCAGAAASLALSYLNNQNSNASYANTCLQYAAALYEFAVENRGLGYSGGFYNSSFDEDELAWAAIWLYIATENESYLNDIVSIDGSGMYTGWLGKIIRSTQDQWQNIWVHSWDTKWGGVFAKLAPITDDPFHWYIFRWNLEYWSGVPHQEGGDGNFIATTPDGFAFLNSWGSARYNAAAQFQGMVYKKYAESNVFDSWMTDQMNYIMGDNPMDRSYIVGYSNSYAEHPHHRAAHGSPNNSMFDPPEHKHILWGALVGGPGADDEHVDETRDFIYNEVAIDYNAGLVGALAGHYYYFGQGHSPLANFPPADPPLTEYSIVTKIEQENAERSQISIKVTNESAFPPHPDVAIRARYYFNISELMEFDQTISDVDFAVYYDENAVKGEPVQSAGPLAHDAANGVYYMEFNWPSSGFYGSRELQFGLIAQQGPDFKAHWDPVNDYSHEGLTSSYVDNGKVPMYADNNLVAGEEPGESQTVPVTGVSVTPTSASVAVNGTQQLTATVAPANATNKTVTWTSSGTAIATVSSSGLVTGRAAGSAVITARTQDGGFTATSTITVTTVTIPVTGVSVTPTSASVEVNGTQQLTATVAPANATNKTVTWASSSTAIATVNSAGLVTGRATGSATITVTTADGGFTATSTITVSDGEITPCDNPVSVSLPKVQNGTGEFCWVTSGNITYVNSWNMTTVEINGVDFTNKWSNSMPARIDGNYYIYYRSTVGWAHLEVNGTDGGNVPVTGVSVTPTTASVNVNGTQQLTATVAPANATNKTVTWTSSSTAIATVSSSGLVTGRAAGSAVVTARTQDGGFTATSTITVTTANVPVTGVSVTPTTASVNVNGTQQLTATVAPANATNKTVTWTSNSTAIATVSSSGLVTGRATGSAVVTVRTQDGGFTATSTITVTTANVPVTGVSVTPATAMLAVNGTQQLTATVAPANATNKTVTWTSGSTAIATVSSSGLVTGRAAGSAVITVRTQDGGFTATCSVTVEDGGQQGCDNPVAISIPFVQNGTGEYCWVTTTAMAYINSWALTELTINGVDFTNIWSDNLPPAQNGQWEIHYVGNYGWSHFEAPAAKDAVSLSSDKNKELRVYPNPYTDEFNIDVTDFENIRKIEILNSLGQVLHQIKVEEIDSNIINIKIEKGFKLLIIRVFVDDQIITRQIIRN